MHLIVDSTGLSIVGEGEWAAAKHGGRGTRGWKKLHVAVNRSGVIIAEVLTEATLDDATTGIDLVAAVDGDMASVTADAAYDSIAFYDAAGARGAQVVVPPTKTARVSRRRPRSSARDRTIRMVKDIGRRQWKKASGYHRQALVENAFFRYKSIIGTGLRARTPGGQRAEALLACNILNRMTDLGGPESYAPPFPIADRFRFLYGPLGPGFGSRACTSSAIQSMSYGTPEKLAPYTTSPVLASTSSKPSDVARLRRPRRMRVRWRVSYSAADV